MSEVNQAFLRAYIKNRASQASPETALDEVASGSKSFAAERKQTVGASQTLSGGQRVRIDSAHLPEVSTHPQQPSPSTRGVWGPIGVERGMKSMEASSVPAIVTNGVTAVTQAAATPTARPISRTSNAPISPAASTSHPSVPRAATPAHPAANAPTQFDQVMFVDGIGPHARPSAPNRTSARTLADIARPIAFGAGENEGILETPALAKPSDPSGPSTPERTYSDLPPASIRIDHPHLRTNPKAPIATPAARSRSSETAPTSTPQVPAARHSIPVDSPKPQPHAYVKPSIELHELPPRAPQSPSVLPLPVAFAASWELDSFPWPEVVKYIEQSNRDAFKQIGKHLASANRDGLKVMSVTSGERGVGRSTVAMHLARCAAAAGLTVALIDGDAFSPSLMDQLKLEVEHGWQDCLFENVPLQEAAIHSIQDRITLFPLTTVISAQQLHANLNRMAKLVKRVSTAFDIVFIDSNRLNLDQRDMMGVGQDSVVDAAIVVVDTELSIKEKVDSAVSILQGMGLASIGLVENFQS